MLSTGWSIADASFIFANNDWSVENRWTFCRILYWSDVRNDSMSGLYALHINDSTKSLLTANSRVRSRVLAVDFAGTLSAASVQLILYDSIRSDELL